MRRYTAKGVGHALGIGEAEIKALTRRGVIHTGKDGLYNIEDTARKIISMLREPEARKRNADYPSERARLMRAKRQSAEYDLKIREGTLHTSEDLERVIAKIFISFKSKIRSIPARVSPQAAKMTSQEEIFDLLKQSTDEALQELSDINAVFSRKEDTT